mmetsp:Transcript_35200/g.101244  ORF Transcript_35200/g.101244 Transcript_35200/m.101244 type:complete len:285 (+) Transcript_35200:490-1344(+)
MNTCIDATWTAICVCKCPFLKVERELVHVDLIKPVEVLNSLLGKVSEVEPAELTCGVKPVGGPCRLIADEIRQPPECSFGLVVGRLGVVDVPGQDLWMELGGVYGQVGLPRLHSRDEGTADAICVDGQGAKAVCKACLDEVGRTHTPLVEVGGRILVSECHDHLFWRLAEQARVPLSAVCEWQGQHQAFRIGAGEDLPAALKHCQHFKPLTSAPDDERVWSSGVHLDGLVVDELSGPHVLVGMRRIDDRVAALKHHTVHPSEQLSEGVLWRIVRQRDHTGAALV